MTYIQTCFHAWLLDLLDCFIILIIRFLVRRGFLPSILWRPPILPTLPFSNFIQHHHPHPHSSRAVKPLSTLFIIFSLWLNEWLCHICWVILLNNIMDLHMLSLVPSTAKDHVVCFMQQGVSSLRPNIWRGFLLVLDLKSYEQRNTAQTGANRMTDAYKHIWTPPVLCSQQLSVLDSMNNLLTSKLSFTVQHAKQAQQHSLRGR